MKKFVAFMEKYFIPVAAKIGGEPHLAAIRDGFIGIIPIIMAGAFAILLNNLSIPGYQWLMESIFGAGWKDFGGYVWNGSYAIMSLLVTFSIAYNLAKSRKKDGLAAGLTAVGSLIILFGTLSKTTSFLGPDGLLLAIVVALVTGDLMCLMLNNPKLVFKMPEGVPPAVAKSFASLFPTIITIGIVAGFQEVCTIFCTTNLPQLIFIAIQAPLQGVVGSLWGALALVFVIQMLWFFGLHGSNMMLPIINGVLLPLTIANMHLVEIGQKPIYIINDQFLNSFVFFGGAGATLCLIIAIFIVNRNRRKKSEVQLAISKIAGVPGIFNINEPLIFGLPICLDTVYLIPFVLVPLVNVVVAYFSMASHLVPLVQLEVTWTLPPIISGALATNSWQGAILSLILMIVDILIYIPFVIVAADRDYNVQHSAQTVSE